MKTTKKQELSPDDRRNLIKLLHELGALSNEELNIWAKTFINNETLKNAILNEYNLRQIA
jgi:hypothetical protein